MYQPPFIEGIYGLRAEGVDVHGATRDKVLYAPLNLWRTARVVRTIVDCLALHALKQGSAFRTVGDKLYRLGRSITLALIDTHYLRDNLTTFLYIHVVALMKVERAYKVFVVESGTAHLGASQLHGLHISHRGYGTRSAHLVCNLEQLGAYALSLVFIGNSPARTLSRHAQRTLLAGGVDLEHYTISRYRKTFTCLIPIVYKVIYLLKRLNLLHAL